MKTIQETHKLADSIYSGGIENFHSWLYGNAFSMGVSHEIHSRVLSVMRLADGIHYTDRRHDRAYYIYHPIRMILGYIEKYQKITPYDTIVFMLHDALEDHPSYWKVIYELVGMQLFRDILILATGGIPYKYRKEMVEFFNALFPDWHSFSPYTVRPGTNAIFDIMRILNPQIPTHKLLTESQYRELNGLQDSQKIEAALNLYKETIIVPKSKGGAMEYDEEYIALGNYIYFTENDTRRKLQDMLDNMSDMETMEKIKPGYTEKRRVKAYILGVKLKNYGMTNEYAELEGAFQKSGSFMLRDDEVLSRYHRNTIL